MSLRLEHLAFAATVFTTMLACSTTSMAAALATWNLNGVHASSDPVPVTTTAVDVTAGNLTKSAALTSTGFLDAFVARDWPLVVSIDLNRYFEFSVTTGAGRAIVFDKVAFSLYNNHAGTSNWEIRSSVDDYHATLASGSATNLVGSGVSIQASVAALGMWQGTVNFRVYTYANTGDLDPDQRGFRGSASGGQDLVVHGTLVGPVGVPGPAALSFRMDAIRPNPVLGSATIGFNVPGSADVDLVVFDAQGRTVRTLLARERTSGQSSVRWDGRTNDGAAASAGVYFAVLRAGTFRASRSLILLR